MSAYDALVIGSGAGGGTLAYRLATAGKRVLILERGGFLPREKANWDTRAVFRENRYHTREIWEDGGGKPLHPQTGYWVGGNTKVYGAALFRLRKEDFEVVRHRGGVSPEWPLKYADFEPYYTRAEKLFQVHGKQGVDPTEPYRSEDYPFPPISNEPRMQEIEDGLRGLGLRPFPTPLGLKLKERNRPESRCIRCDTCDAYPCLVHAKSDADVDCIRKIMHLENVTLITHAKVLRLDTNATGTEIASVEAEIADAENPTAPPRRTNFSADLYVVSCGAINSAALLLRSANERHPDGFANRSGQVGRNLMFHEADVVLAVTAKKTRGRYLKTVSVNDFYFGDADYPYPMGNIQPLGSVHSEMIKSDAPRFTPLFLLRLLAERAVPWWLTTEDLPNSENRVTLSNGTIRLDYRANNLESFHRLRKTWIRALKRIGHADQTFRFGAYFNRRAPLGAVGHQNGTCRFGADPATSVLDLNCRAHEIANLYVVDSSFFPSCGAVNPCLTVIANALRVGDHLVDRLG